MTKKLLVAVLLMLTLDVATTAYGAVAVQDEGQSNCSRAHGTVQGHNCVVGGQVLFRVPR